MNFMVMNTKTTSTSQKPQQNLEQKTEDDASNVLNNRTIKRNFNTESNDEVIKSVAEEDKEGQKKTTTNMLKVNKLPVGTTENSLEYFFENTRKFGGGDVERVEYDEDASSAIITFVGDDAVDKVVQKMPILFNKKVVEVEAYVEAAMDITEEEFYDCDGDSQEHDITCTIEVRDMNSSTTKDAIMFYFESKKGANTDVEKVQFIEDKNMYLVTFEEEEGVNRALEKSHMVDHAKLQVRKHVPPKRYPNKALIKGLSEKTSKDGLINFLEAKTKKDVVMVDFGDEDSKKAIVTFDQSIDIDQLQTTCKKKSLDGSFVTIHPVFVTNCIIVRGFTENTTEDRLEWYFDNKKKSGVEGVTEIKRDKEEGYCIIYFQNSKDALIACQRKHTVDNCKLQVQVFYECLGIPASDEGSKFTTPPPIIIDSIDKRKIAFFLHSKSSKATLEKQVHDMHGQITWPSGKDIKFKIECTLTKETKDCRRLAKTWKADTKKQIDSFVDNLDIEKHAPLQEAWILVMEKLRQINIENTDMVTVSVEKPPTCEIYVVGLHNPVEEVSDKVKVIIEEVTEELNTKKQQIQEEVKLKHFQLLILVFIHFPDKIKERFDNMEVKINTKKLVITFNGISKDITSAKVFTFETVNSIVKAPIGKKSQIFIKFLKDPEVGALVGRKIKEKGYVGVWDIQDNSIMMYSISDEDAVAAADIFKESLTETKVDVEGLQKSMLNSRKWTAHAQSIEDEYQQKSIITKIVVDQEQITVLCTSKGEAGIIREKIQDFFQLNTENEITIDLPPAQLKFLQEHMKDEVEKLERTLKQKNVIVAVKSDGILVKGNQQGVKDAADEVDSLVQKIYQMKHSMDKPGLQELMQTSKGKQKLMQVGKQADVVISNESDEDQKSTGRGIHPRSTGSASEGTVYTTNWGQEVIVVQGDIIQLDVDVIVNAANKDLVHSGGLAKVLVKKGGPSIQTECTKYIKVNGQLSEGEIFCSGPGNLKCQIIIHAVGPVWQGGGNQEEDHLYLCIESALKESENRNLSSIAIPALCTGIFGYPSKEATKVICEAIKDYFEDNQASTVETVYLCDIANKNVNFFEMVGNKFFDTDHSRKPVGGQQRDRFSGGSSSDISMGNIKIKILKGELAKMRVGAIVNTTSTDLKLDKGAVSATLLKKGGPILQQECSQKYPKGVRYGEVAVTSGGQLQCQIVCHGSLDQWRKDGSSIKVLENFVMGCLATADKQNCQSIALPAMGTGQLGYPKELVAKHMYSCVEQFSSKNPKSNITEVIFVLFHKDYSTVKAFEDEERDRQSTTHGRHLTRTPTTYQGRGWYLDEREEFVEEPHMYEHSDVERDDDCFITDQDYTRDLRSGHAVFGKERHQIMTQRKHKGHEHRDEFHASPVLLGRHVQDKKQSGQFNVDTRTQARKNVLGRVDSEQMSKLEHILAFGQKPQMMHMSSAPVLGNQYGKPVRKIKSQTSIKNWEKIKKSNYLIEDPEIELAMLLVKNSHPKIGGLQPVVVAIAEGYTKPQGQFIQIVNVKGQHWITLSNIGCRAGTVRVYDSWKRSLHTDTKAAILATVNSDGSDKIIVDVSQFQRQRNESDCGLFAVAAMVALAHGSDPSKLIWDLRTLRSHFVECLDQSQMTPFPLYQSSTGNGTNILPQKSFSLTVCNSCKQNICDQDETQCKKCFLSKVKPW